MATILDKDLTRETTVRVEDREIQITLTEKQSISLKLKGMKSGAVEIGIGDLYNNLKVGTSLEPEVEVSVVKSGPVGTDLSSYKDDGAYLISLHEIRAAALVRSFDLETTSKFDSFLADLINERKARIVNLENTNKKR